MPHNKFDITFSYKINTCNNKRGEQRFQRPVINWNTLTQKLLHNMRAAK